MGDLISRTGVGSCPEPYQPSALLLAPALSLIPLTEDLATPRHPREILQQG